MGLHNNIFEALKLKLEDVTGLSVVHAVSVDDALNRSLGTYIAVLLKDRTLEQSEVLGGGEQEQHFHFNIFVISGAGAADLGKKEIAAWKVLETIEDAINQEDVYSSGGPFQLIQETFEGTHGAAVVFLQRYSMCYFG